MAVYNGLFEIAGASSGLADGWQLIVTGYEYATFPAEAAEDFGGWFTLHSTLSEVVVSIAEFTGEVAQEGFGAGWFSGSYLLEHDDARWQNAFFDAGANYTEGFGAEIATYHSDWSTVTSAAVACDFTQSTWYGDWSAVTASSSGLTENFAWS
jgi:hypothetical protein